MSESKYNCPVDAAICKIGGKYKAVILYHLKSETLRYNEIKRKIKRITDKMLAQQLRELESDGLVKRRVYAVVPPKTEYSLTPLGMTLSPILDALCQWGEQFMEETEEQELELSLKDEEWPFEYTDHDRDVVRAIVYDKEGFLYFVKIFGAVVD